MLRLRTPAIGLRRPATAVMAVMLVGNACSHGHTDPAVATASVPAGTSVVTTTTTHTTSYVTAPASTSSSRLAATVRPPSTTTVATAPRVTPTPSSGIAPATLPLTAAPTTLPLTAAPTTLSTTAQTTLPPTTPPTTLRHTTAPTTPPATAATPICVKGSLVSPAQHARVGQHVDVQARLTGSAGQDCSSIGVDAEVDVVDRGISYPWALYCTFSSCRRNGVVLGNMPSDPGQSYGLTLTVNGASVFAIQVTRSA